MQGRFLLPVQSASATTSPALKKQKKNRGPAKTTKAYDSKTVMRYAKTVFDSAGRCMEDLGITSSNNISLIMDCVLGLFRKEYGEGIINTEEKHFSEIDKIIVNNIQLFIANAVEYSSGFTSTEHALQVVLCAMCSDLLPTVDLKTRLQNVCNELV